MILSSSGLDEPGAVEGNPACSDGSFCGNGPDRQGPGEAPVCEFSEQLEKEIPFLRRRVRRWNCSEADADDLIQDTLVQALANAHQWQPGSDLRAWLFTIMRNRFLARAHKSARSAAALEGLAAVDAEPPPDPREARLILRDLGAALRKLTDDQRSAVLLIGAEEKSYAEAAQSMGISVGAVRSHLARGRERLRSAVNGVEARPPFARRSAPEPSASTV
jgi:RNA polymerase sigma-70 factor (ECF subfamily)